MIDRFMQMDRRAKIFVLLGLALLILGLTGLLSASRGVEIERDEAIELALPHIDFEPTSAEARLFRQGVGLIPVWAVSFTIPKAGSSREFVRLATVEIDARTGDVIRISRDEDPEPLITNLDQGS